MIMAGYNKCTSVIIIFVLVPIEFVPFLIHAKHPTL